MLELWEAYWRLVSCACDNVLAVWLPPKHYTNNVIEFKPRKRRRK